MYYDRFTVSACAIHFRTVLSLFACVLQLCTTRFQCAAGLPFWYSCTVHRIQQVSRIRRSLPFALLPFSLSLVSRTIMFAVLSVIYKVTLVMTPDSIVRS